MMNTSSMEQGSLLSEDDIYSEGANPVVVLVFASLGLVVSLLMCILFVVAPTDYFRQRWSGYNKAWRRFWIIMSTALVLLTALAIGYGAESHAQHGIDYHGPMRVASVSFSNTTWCKNNEPDKPGPCNHYTHFTTAIIEVEWGYDWACPSSGSGTPTVCRTTITDDCWHNACESRGSDKESCSYNEWQGAAAYTRSCVKAWYNYANNENYTAVEDPSIPPGEDENWLSFVAYGNCQKCRMTKHLSDPEKVETFGLSMRILLAVTLTPLVAILVYFYVLVPVQRRWQKFRPKSSNIDSSSVPEHPKPNFGTCRV